MKMTVGRAFVLPCGCCCDRLLKLDHAHHKVTSGQRKQHIADLA